MHFNAKDLPKSRAWRAESNSGARRSTPVSLDTRIYCRSALRADSVAIMRLANTKRSSQVSRLQIPAIDSEKRATLEPNSTNNPRLSQREARAAEAESDSAARLHFAFGKGPES